MAGGAADGRAISKTELIRQLHGLGVEPDSMLLVHSAFRAVRPVEGGPLGLIEGLQTALGPRGTLVMPAMTDDDDHVFDPATAPAHGMGIVADSFWRLPGVRRSNHFAAFAAFGPHAAEITADHPSPPVQPHGPESPVDRVRALDGQILLLGVGHDANTTIHLAECLAGVPYRLRHHYTALRNGRPERIDYDEIDHCCQRFALADDWLRARELQREGKVGHATARLFRARDLVSVVAERLTAAPLTFLHAPAEGCEECNTARAGMWA